MIHAIRDNDGSGKTTLWQIRVIHRVKQARSVAGASRHINAMKCQARQVRCILSNLIGCLICERCTLPDLHGRRMIHDQEGILWNRSKNWV